MLLTYTCPAISMEKPKAISTTFSKTVMATLTANNVEPKKVRVQLQINVPATITTDEEKAHIYTSRKETVFAQLQQVLIAYEKAQQQEPAVDNHFVTIDPTELFYNADTNNFVLRQNWGTHTLTDALTANLETRMSCTYVPEQQLLTAGTPTLYITQEGSEQPQTVTMAEFHNQFPHKHTLNLNEQTMHGVAKIVMGMALKRYNGLIAGENPDALPKPDEFRNKLFVEDLKKTVKYHLLNKII